MNRNYENRFIIGIDCGGTKTDVLMTDLNLKICYQEKFKGINIQRESEVKVKYFFYDIVFEIIKHIINDIGKIEKIVIGAAGAGRDVTKKKIIDSFRNTILSERVVVFSDMYIAYRSAFYGDRGILVNSGTGSFAYTINEKGQEIRTGGWGYLVGDEGSGFDIGREGIRTALKSFDGRLEKSILEKKICSRFCLKSINEIIPLIYDEKITLSDISMVSSLVFDAAKEGDKQAKNIIKKAVDEIILHLEAMERNFYKKEEPINIIFYGGVFKENKDFIRAIEEKIGRRFNIIKRDIFPVRGAIITIIEQLGLRLDNKCIKDFLSG
ncbi:hypothetical protein DRQ09_02040 [candidate division KSB1 bacterium]|nr:MAG: hypothetical protein DRQ09_02040 [candidate division KSB1 bacterium]